MWSGGNELFNSWSGMTDQSLALRLLNSQCLKLDPYTPYINTSPLVRYGTRPLCFQGHGYGRRGLFHHGAGANTAYTEFGMPAPSSVEICETIIPEEELWPP